jgi:hypothetical protein
MYSFILSRWSFWFLCLLGITSVILVTFFIPETLRALVGNGSGYANPTPYQWISRRRGKLDEDNIAAVKASRGPRRHINFFKPFMFLGQPDVFILLLFGGCLYLSFNCFLSSTTKQFQINYGLSELEIGFCFVSQSMGLIIGSFAKGKLLDREFNKLSKEFHDKYPEKSDEDISFYDARLKSCWPILISVDLVPIIYGWIMYYKAPLSVALILQFLCNVSYLYILDDIDYNLCTAGITTSASTICVQALIVDLFPEDKSSITSSFNLIRCSFG